MMTLAVTDEMMMMAISTSDLLGLAVFKLNVQAVLNPNLHLDAVVRLRVVGKGMDHEHLLLDDVTKSLDDRHPQQIPDSS